MVRGPRSPGGKTNGSHGCMRFWAGRTNNRRPLGIAGMHSLSRPGAASITVLIPAFPRGQRPIGFGLASLVKRRTTCSFRPASYSTFDGPLHFPLEVLNSVMLAAPVHLRAPLASASFLLSFVGQLCAN